jgi:hypothetical protein
MDGTELGQDKVQWRADEMFIGLRFPGVKNTGIAANTTVSYLWLKSWTDN